MTGKPKRTPKPNRWKPWPGKDRVGDRPAYAKDQLTGITHSFSSNRRERRAQRAQERKSQDG